MTHNSNKAWSLIRKLSNDPRKADQHVNVTPNQVAQRLILNGNVPNRERQSKIKRCGQENHDFDDDFTIIELQNSLSHLKNGKATGLYEILTDEIWRHSHVFALLKPGKDPSSLKRFRPISNFVSHQETVRGPDTEPLSHIIEHVPEQAGFRPCKYCTSSSHVLNITQHIEDDFESGKITGILIVDLPVAYDTVNHRRLLEKFYNVTRDYRLMCTIHTLVENRRFFMGLRGKISRWRSQSNDRGVSSHHFSSTYAQTTIIFTRALAALCMQTT